MSHACRATQDGRVIVKSSDKMWSTGEGNGKPLQYSCLESPMNSMKRQKDNDSERKAVNKRVTFSCEATSTSSAKELKELR